ncbi:VPLPA-CTERM sorting domain-containing protein [Sulfitobacter sp. LCG007]
MTEVTMMKLLMLACAVSLSATAGFAASTGYDVKIKGSSDAPSVKIMNKSTSAAITSFSISVGNRSYEFDSVKSLKGGSKGLDGGKQKLKKGSKSNGAGGSNKVKLKYSGFDAGEFAKFRTELDKNGKNETNADFRDVLFGNGKGKNAVIKVAFSDGTVLRQRLGVNKAMGDKDMDSRSFRFSKSAEIAGVNNSDAQGIPSGSGGTGSTTLPNGVTVPGNSGEAAAPANLSPVPLPAGGLLMVSGLGAFAALRRRRRAA